MNLNVTGWHFFAALSLCPRCAAIGPLESDRCVERIRDNAPPLPDRVMIVHLGINWFRLLEVTAPSQTGAGWAARLRLSPFGDFLAPSQRLRATA